MEWSTEQTRWLVKVLHPERTLASLPGGWAVTEETHAALLGLKPDIYSAERARLRTGAKEAARELLADPAVATCVDRLPLTKGAKIVAFGDSHTADPQSWAVILGELLAARRPQDNLSFGVSAVSGETTTHGLIRMGEVTAQHPDWILFFIGVNDARTQGPKPAKTLVDHQETARNLAELRKRASTETKARRLWIAPPAVDAERVKRHWALSNFGVQFLNEDIARVGKAVRELGEPAVDLFAELGAPPPPALLMEDGLHFTQAGQQRVALEILRGWSRVAQG
jgi:lysophospholipase L1-like esterase